MRQEIKMRQDILLISNNISCGMLQCALSIHYIILLLLSSFCIYFCWCPDASCTFFFVVLLISFFFLVRECQWPLFPMSLSLLYCAWVMNLYFYIYYICRHRKLMHCVWSAERNKKRKMCVHLFR